jgi:hypothetical protein
MTVDVAPGTVVVHTDVVCAWSTVSLQRFSAARSRLGLDDRVRVDHRLYLLARGCDRVDAGALAAALEGGRARGPMMADHRSHADEVQGSPQFFLADGSDVHDPGISLRWADAGYPQIDTDDPGAHNDLVRRAADAAQGAA